MLMALENVLHATFTVCLQPKINYRIYNISSVTIFFVAFANLGKKVFTVFISNRDIIISVPYLAGSICVFCFAAAVCLLFSKHTLYLGFAFPGKLIIYLPINYCGFPHVLSMWEFVVLIGLMFLYPVSRNRSIHERPRFVPYYPALIVETFVARSTGRGLRSAGYDSEISSQ